MSKDSVPLHKNKRSEIFSQCNDTIGKPLQYGTGQFHIVQSAHHHHQHQWAVHF
jgi:hypothetical protein